jgi:uncharacterized membrane protein
VKKFAYVLGLIAALAMMTAIGPQQALARGHGGHGHGGHYGGGHGHWHRGYYGPGPCGFFPLPPCWY